MGPHNQRRIMEEEQQPEQNPGWDESEVDGFQKVLLEVDLASHDLGEFLRWCADQGATEDDDAAEEFTLILGYVYSFCRARNDQTIGAESGTDDPGSSSE